MKPYIPLFVSLLVSPMLLAGTITEIAKENKNFTILSKALEATGLDEALDVQGEYTVFAPTDDAFKRLPKGTLETLLKPENKEKLATILKYHVVGQKVNSKQAVTLEQASTLADIPVAINFEKARLYIEDAKVIDADIKASNGIIHVLNDVLVPKLSSPDSKSSASRKMFLEAIDSGVDLFNEGNTEACEAIYKVAVRGVIHIAPDSLDTENKEVLKKALMKVEKSNDSRANAWTLRRAMNKVLPLLEK